MKRVLLNTKAALAFILSIGLLTGCEPEGKKKDANTPSISMSLTKSTNNKGRVKLVKQGKTLPKRHRLQLVGTIAAPQDRTDLMWSATSVAVNPNNTAENNIAYVTWHSNYQATNPATQWGGAIDIVNMNNGDLTGYMNAKEGMKFNHVLYSGNRLFLSTTSAECGAAIGRVELNADGTEILGENNVARIGFPGASVNAVAEYNGQMLAVSGHRGTYATFDPNMEPALYNYLDLAKNEIEPMTEDLQGFGGKYVLAANNTAYVLYDKGEGAVIEDMDGNKVETSIRLTSGNKTAELYDEKTGEWVLIGEGTNYYGKHTMAINGNYAYVACGYNGMIGVNLTTGEKVYNNNIMTIGLFANEEYLFAATAQGLRIFKFLENGDLNLYAWEVETYDENGLPTSDLPATIETPLRHSPNFVTYDAATGYIYVAYGQTGVRVYRFRTDDATPNPIPTDEGVDMGGDILWATEDLEGYYSWGEIFNIDDEAGKTLEYNGITYTNDGSYYIFSNTNKTSYKDYTNYKFFDNTAKLTKYTWQNASTALSEDGKTVLEAMDDAATVRLGNGWRMPTQEEWKELRDNLAEAEEVEKDGEMGLLLTAENGNTLFLPKNGFYNQSGNLEKTNEIYYWSSSLCPSTNRNSDANQMMTGGWIYGGAIKRQWCTESLATAFYVYPKYMSIDITGYDRCYGMKIRPVKDK